MAVAGAAGCTAWPLGLPTQGPQWLRSPLLHEGLNKPDGLAGVALVSDSGCPLQLTGARTCKIIVSLF